MRFYPNLNSYIPTNANRSGGGCQAAISIDSVEGLSWGSINVEGETLPLQMRIAERHQFQD
ncbi:MAG: hypothetical protein EWV53_16485 [Microcystis panniformis Mp_MB_F_20051200_S9]|uniref:Uncharacterized protein n=2 Tax=Microcystis TaxID=1125 RepID=A0A552PRL6_9CHRO|nr:MAG: hypothetical protein EWV61_18060 [Microcystis aeruginosa Ma_AC_P_19900807_S300]TRV42286.1 MAG: hypothetical protein EWV43_23020 [Microcystis panniformis Mp_MB_F_20080800_S26D]TRV47783.1 MAG: hypothetical protein EWV87_13390 [Microcystis panniformis Mp_GB_SS_20050300_S99]TRV53166.1 MAG: hypothetical protein EWV42_06555 [Microcystis panniformis Mp_GB_SS_20050300_S99D]TRV59635.1 MAG: hypothetical protein EWV53_16485 [Microcystis panniformis Mp_MB_F_20051200_S9]TRV64242.1 MAG: hypothetical